MNGKRILGMIKTIVSIRLPKGDRIFAKEIQKRVDSLEKTIEQATLNGEDHWFCRNKKQEKDDE